MRGAGVDKGTCGNGMWGEGQGDEKGIGIRKSRCVETNEFSSVGKVNATLRPCSILLRVADYFFESMESAFDSGAETLAA